MRRFLSVLAALGPFLSPFARAGEPDAHWIWKSADAGRDERVFFRREFELPQDVVSAAVTVACDDWQHVWFNGHDLSFAGDWSNPRGYDVAALVKQGGRNVIAVEGRNEGGAAAMALRF